MILLTDEETIEAINKGVSEDMNIDPEPEQLYRYVKKAQLKKVVGLIIADSEGFDGYNQSPVIISHKLWQALLGEIK